MPIGMCLTIASFEHQLSRSEELTSAIERLTAISRSELECIYLLEETVHKVHCNRKAKSVEISFSAGSDTSCRQKCQELRCREFSSLAD